MLQQAGIRTREPGTVYLVGAGPGDPELLTVRALRLLQSGKVIVYDRLVSPAILELVPEGVQRIFVGKSAGCHVLRQEEINHLLVRLARAGHDVVRLKGGDPFIFGRGAEEALALRRAGVRFEVVPGITAALGCSAYAGIPLTHRDLATGVRFVTGHLKDGAPEPLDWAGMADDRTTLVVYMGVAQMPLIRDQLQAAGRAGSTPVALIERGTTASQRVVSTCLADMVEAVQHAGMSPPVLTVIGEVASLARELAWFEPTRAAPAELSPDPELACAG